MASVANINDVLEGHVALEIECVDRLYLNAYVPTLQVGGQVIRFFCSHLGKPIASTALFEPIGNRFRREVKRFAAERNIPILELKKPDRSRWDDRKLDHVHPHLQRAEREGRYGVVAIVSCQEYQWVFSGRNRQKKPGARPNFEFFREDRRVGTYYFYILDREWGPGFLKLCTYCPWPGKVWLNGHEWVKRQALREGLGYTELENGFAACSDPERLQALCDSLSPQHVQAFFDRWMPQIPTPLGPQDRAGGYWWELSMRQTEVSRTLVFDAPRRARAFFEALVADNIGVGRPEDISLAFARKPRSKTDRFATRVLTRGTDVRIDFTYKSSRVKQYLKGGRALRIETVINRPSDLSLKARLQHLPELIDKARAINRRLLMIERAGQSCAIGSALFERIHQPYNDQEGHRAGPLRFGDWRVMALVGALCCVLPAVTGFTNKSLRGLVAGLLGQDYSQNQMSYDLRRLRLHGLIQRLPHKNTYVLTPEGIRAAVFYTKLQNRLLRPLLDANQPPARVQIRCALATLEHAVAEYVQNARLAPAP
jgi:hypothetical protein